VLGRIAAPFGVKGLVKVKPFTARFEALLDYDEVLVGRGEAEGDAQWSPVRLRGGRRHGDVLLLEFEGVGDRDHAERLQGCSIAVRRESLPRPETDEIYLVDLIGSEVVDGSGCRLGVIDGFIGVGDSQVMRVVDDSGAKRRERLIPLLEQYVVAVEAERRRVTVDWPEDF